MWLIVSKKKLLIFNLLYLYYFIINVYFYHFQFLNFYHFAPTVIFSIKNTFLKNKEKKYVKWKNINRTSSIVTSSKIGNHF